MKISVVYSNALGNTKMLADKVNETLGADKISYFGLTSDKALDSDRIYVGFWTDKGTSDQISTEFLKKLKGKEVFLFGSAGFGKGDYFDKILDSVKLNLDESNTVIGTFMCQGKMKMSVRERYVSMKKNGVAPPNVDMLIANFDEALAHPNDDDLNNLLSEVSKIK